MTTLAWLCSSCLLGDFYSLSFFFEALCMKTTLLALFRLQCETWLGLTHCTLLDLKRLRNWISEFLLEHWITLICPVAAGHFQTRVLPLGAKGQFEPCSLNVILIISGLKGLEFCCSSQPVALNKCQGQLPCGPCDDFDCVTGTQCALPPPFAALLCSNGNWLSNNSLVIDQSTPPGSSLTFKTMLSLI